VIYVSRVLLRAANLAICTEPSRWFRAIVTTYLKLEDVVDLVEFLLVPIQDTAKSATQLPVGLVELNGGPPSHVSRAPAVARNPSADASYLAVNSSNVSSACASFFLAADCEKARWAVQAMGIARVAGTRAPTRLACDAERTKDMVRQWAGDERSEVL